MPPGETPASHLRKLVEAGLARRYSADAADRCGACCTATRRSAARRPADVRELIEHELALIAELRYEPYFLTVHDIVAFARAQGILCQGRGSAANSAVCYALGITEVDPARMSDAVRALHQQGAQRAARHRRRLRAPAARGSDPVRLRASTAATARRSPRRSSPTGRRARCATSARRSGLDLAQVDRLAGVFAWWDGRAIDRRAHPRGGLRSRQPGDPRAWSRWPAS